MSLKINNLSLSQPKTAQINFGAKNPASLVKLTKGEILQLLSYDTQKPLGNDVVEICKKMTTSQTPVNKSVFERCQEAIINQCEEFKVIAKNIKKASQKGKSPESFNKEIVKTNQKLDEMFLASENPFVTVKPVKIAAAKKALQNVELSKSEILSILGQDQAADLSHNAVLVCKKLTGEEHVTKSVFNQCLESLTSGNEVLKEISKSLQNCIDKTHNALEISNNIAKNRKRLDAVILSKDNPKYRTRQVVLDKNLLENEAKMHQQQNQEWLIANEKAKAEALVKNAAKLEKEKWVNIGNEQLKYVETVSQKNKNLPVFVRTPRGERMSQDAKRRKEIINTVTRDNAAKLVKDTLNSIKNPEVLPAVTENNVLKKQIGQVDYSRIANSEGTIPANQNNSAKLLN